MKMIHNVPGPSQEAFNTLNNQTSSLNAAKLPSGNGYAVDVSSCSTLTALFDAIDGHTSPVGMCGTGNQQSNNAKTLLGGSGISNYDECVIYRLSYNQYIAIASSDVLSGACKIKILSRAGNARTDASRMSQTAWLTLPT